MTVTRFKLPFGKMPTKYDEQGVEQWRDYCAVTDVSSNKPNEIVIVDLVLTGLTKEDAVKVADVLEVTSKDTADFRLSANTGLPKVSVLEAEKG